MLDALLIACAVLIITCPCALALAVPAVQVLATGQLFRIGIVLKSPTALERLAAVDTVVFDKTGTLTEPLLELRRTAGDGEVLAAAATLAVASRHPLARALVAASGPAVPAIGVVELPGQGMQAADGARLGSARFTQQPAGGDAAELWYARPDQPAVRFQFVETARPDARATVAALRRRGYSVHLLSGDRPAPVAAIAGALGIDRARAEQSPTDKLAALEALRAEGRRVLMVGDGLNDSPSLAAAFVSMSPACAADISQTLADVVFQGRSLAPVDTVLRLARAASVVMRQNIALAIVYNLVMVPLAVSGHITPWLAAATMSSSSLLVMANSFRVQRISR